MELIDSLLKEEKYLEALEKINFRLGLIRSSNNFKEKELEDLLQKRIEVKIKLKQVDELILDAVRAEKYPPREEYKVGRNTKVILEFKNIFQHSSEAIVSTIHTNRFFNFSERGASSELIKRVGKEKIENQLKSSKNFSKNKYITIKHEELNSPISYHIPYYLDTSDLNLAVLERGIQDVLNECEIKKYKDISFFALGFYYVLIAEEKDKHKIATAISETVAQAIINFFYEKDNTSIQTIYFGFVNNKTMQTMDRAFFKWTSFTKQQLFIQKELSERQKNIVRSALTEDPTYIEILKELSYSLHDNSTILLLGESGVGKSYLAKIIHENGNRREKPFLSDNCALITPENISIKLFGWIKGSFTNAIADGFGLFSEADQGTLFLDEIGNVGIEVQKMLLTFFNEGEFFRFGDNKVPFTSDIKLIFGTNVDLENHVTNGYFAHDLYERIYQRVITIPPLRNRKSDIKILINKFVSELNITNQYLIEFDSEVIELLCDFPWYGNVRQLKFYVENIYNICRLQNINIINKQVINENPPRKTQIGYDKFSQLEQLLIKILSNWPSQNGPFIDKIVKPIISKIYLQDLKGNIKDAHLNIGIEGRNGKISEIYKKFEIYSKAKQLLQ
jgi:DNA-binding NtrC family response regulator